MLPKRAVLGHPHCSDHGGLSLTDRPWIHPHPALSDPPAILRFWAFVSDNRKLQVVPG